MSKIMRQIYAEARAAREAISGSGGPRTRGAQFPVPDPLASAKSMMGRWTLPVPEPAARARSVIEWWTVQLAKAGERCVSPKQVGNAVMEKRQ